MTQCIFSTGNDTSPIEPLNILAILPGGITSQICLSFHRTRKLLGNCTITTKEPLSIARCKQVERRYSDRQAGLTDISLRSSERDHKVGIHRHQLCAYHKLKACPICHFKINKPCLNENPHRMNERIVSQLSDIVIAVKCKYFSESF